MRYRRMVAMCVLALTACEKPTSLPDPEIAITRSHLVALEARVQRMEQRAVPDYAAMKPGEDGYRVMQSAGYMLRVRLDDVKPSGNGSKATISIGNLMAMGLRDCTLSVVWGSTDSAGSAVAESRHEQVFRISDEIPGGDFAFPELLLSDIQPSKLGYVTLNEVLCLRNSRMRI